jgi:riboflavin kinase / FMN adenylyltransferase
MAEEVCVVQRWRGCEQVPQGWGRSVVTIGVFDGVHCGHQQTIGYAVKRATELGARSVVLTFDPHPAEVVRPGSHPTVLTELDAKAELMAALGVDALCVIPFTRQFAELTAEAFVRQVLVERLGTQVVVVGQRFRFGRTASGDVALLRQLGARLDFGVEEAALVGEQGTVFSSTYIRARIAAGEVELAGRALGRPHRITGQVVTGDRRGRELGFPTANLDCPQLAAIPADGVYAAWFNCGADRWPAAVSVGTNPTFGGVRRRVEAHVLDFAGDLYGRRVSLDLLVRLRPMVAFENIAALVEQLHTDVDQVRQIMTPHN